MNRWSEPTIKVKVRLIEEEELKGQGNKGVLPIVGNYHGMANEFADYCRRQGYKTKSLEYGELEEVANGLQETIDRLWEGFLDEE